MQVASECSQGTVTRPPNSICYKHLGPQCLFDYDYLNPIEGRWRLAPAWPPSLGWGWGLGSGHGWGPFAPRVTFPGGPELELGGGCLSPGEREGGSRRRLKPPLEGTRLTLPGGAPVSSYFSPRVPGSEAKGSRGSQLVSCPPLVISARWKLWVLPLEGRGEEAKEWSFSAGTGAKRGLVKRIRPPPSPTVCEPLLGTLR